MIEILFGVLIQGLKLMNTIESQKYMDEVLKLQKDWLKEYEKPRKDRINSELDHIEQRLRLIGKVFIDANGEPKA